MEIVIRKIDSREKKNRTNGKAIAGQRFRHQREGCRGGSIFWFHSLSSSSL